jgi:hypothetical protein
VKAFAGGKLTVSDAIEAYLRKVQASVSLKPRSNHYREMMIDFIRRSIAPRLPHYNLIKELDDTEIFS